MRETRLFGGFEFGHDALRQNLPQLHSPLVEGIDIPDGALDEDAVFVKGNKLAPVLPASTARAGSYWMADCLRTCDVARGMLVFLPPRPAAWSCQRPMLQPARKRWPKGYRDAGPIAFSGLANAMKSQGMSRVPWWIN